MHRFFSPLTLLILAVAVIITIAGAIIYLSPSYFTTDKANFWVALSVALATSGWLLSAAISLHNNRRQHTFSLIYMTRFNDQYQKNVSLLYKQFGYSKEISKKIAKYIENSDLEPTITISRAVLQNANFFEYLAMAIKYNDVDEKIVRDYYEDIINNFYRRFVNFIPLWRTTYPECFTNLEWLYERWNKPYIIF